VRILVVCNPISGGGRAGGLGAELAQRLEAAGHAVDLYRTTSRGDARERAARVDSDLDRIVVVGGDGTINEVLNGLPDPERIPLTQLATGTANLLAHELRLPYSAEAMSRLLGNGTIRRLDLGLAGDRRFLMVTSAGFDAMVTLEAQGQRRGTMSYARWVPSIVRVARRYHPPRLEVQVDDAAPVACEMVIVSNIRNYGGLFTAADLASPDSGHLDICALERAGIPALVGATWSAFFRRGLSDHPGVRYMTGRQIRIRADETVPVEVDGDPAGMTPVDISVLPRVVPVVVPSA
jgi:YegS/Rv2252/BmrU family lipid kinase